MGVHIKRTNKYCAAKIRVVEKNRNPVTPSRIRTKSRNHPSISNYAEYMINDPRDRFNSLSAKNGENGSSQGLTREFSGVRFFDRQRSINERQKRDSISRISPNNGQNLSNNNFHQNPHHQQQQNSRATNNSITSTLQGSNTGSMSDIPNKEREASKYKSKKENSINFNSKQSSNQSMLSTTTNSSSLQNTVSTSIKTSDTETSDFSNTNRETVIQNNKTQNQNQRNGHVLKSSVSERELKMQNNNKKFQSEQDIHQELNKRGQKTKNNNNQTPPSNNRSHQNNSSSRNTSSENNNNNNNTSSTNSVRQPRFIGKRGQVPVPNSDGTNVENNFVLRQPSTGMVEVKGFTLVRKSSVKQLS